MLGSDETSALPKITAYVIIYISFPLLMFVSGVCYGWIYWWLVFLFPHLGTTIQLLARRIDSDAFEFAKFYCIYFPYEIGCYCLEITGLEHRIVSNPGTLHDQEPKWMSFEETKQYYLPVRDVLIVFIALLLLSKVVFDSVK